MRRYPTINPSAMMVANAAIPRVRFVLNEMGKCSSAIGLSCFAPASAQCLEQADDGVEARQLDLKQDVFGGEECSLGVENRQHGDGAGAKLSAGEIQGPL